MSLILALLALGRHLLEEHQGGSSGPDRAPQGWVRTDGALCRYPPTPAPLLGASGARFAGICSAYGSPSLAAGHGITHPVYPPWYTHPARTTLVPTRHAPSTLQLTGCTDTRFWDTVGEPRGMRTHRVSRVPGRLYTVFEVWEGLHGRLTEFY